MLRRALRNGYLDAELTIHTVEVDRRARTANIRLHLETGERYYFGAITVEQDAFAPEFIQKFITLREGEPYSSDAILEQQNVLGDSDYFTEIYVQPRRDLAKGYVIPVEIVPVLRKPNKYSFGIGFSTDTGIRGSVGWERRRLNRQGHRVSASINLSGIGGGVGTRYRIPIRNPRDDEFNITAAYVVERPETRESRITQLGFARMIQRGHWRETLAIDFQREDFEAGIQEDTTQVVVPSIDYTRRVPRRQLYVPKGHRITGTLRGAHDELFSNTTFAQTRVFTKWILPVGKRGRFLARGEAGYSAVDTVFDLPASYRFYAGGDQSVRGYEFASLGPTDPLGQVIGGKHLIVGSVELEHRVVGKWSVAAFFDAGNAFNTLDDLEIAQGAGVGARWTSPIGQIRLDVASAISEPDQPWRIHISIGPDL
jgi:translocation and assembly module TamA